LKREDRAKLLRLAMRLVDSGSVEFARAFYELSPFLSDDEKREYGGEALRSGRCSLIDLLSLSSCFNYLPRDDAVKKIRSCIEALRQELHSTDSSERLAVGFKMFAMQQALATIVESESDSVSAIANITEQDDLLGEASKCFEGFSVWLNRVRLAQGSQLYLQALGAADARRLELLGEARKKALSAIRLLEKLNDYYALFSAFRLLFLIDFRKFLTSRAEDSERSTLARRAGRYAEASARAAEAFGGPVEMAASYTNVALAMKLQAQHETNIVKKKRLFESARDTHLKAASIVKDVSEGLVSPHLYNAGCTLAELSQFETNVVKLNELFERASREMDEVIMLSSGSSQVNARFSAIVVKLICMQELADINPVSLTADHLTELNRLSKELEELVSRIYDPQLLVLTYLNLSRYYLKLLRVTVRDQDELMERAERNAFKAYQTAEVFQSDDGIRRVLPNLAEVLMVRGILSRNMYTLEEASNLIDRARKLLAGKEDPELLRTHSTAAEIHLVKYGYTGDQKELRKAITCLSESAAAYISNRYLQFAGEELFKLATVHMLIQENRKAENALDKAARLFKKSGDIEPAFKRESLKFAATCKATKKLVQAQTVFNTGDKSRAMKLVEQAEKQMVQANARWREVWLIRGFRELILGNLEEAKNNLVRVVKESLDVVDDKNPTSTGHTAKKLVSFIDEEGRVEKRLPPATIDLPLRTESVVAADKLDRLSRELSPVTSMETREEKKVNVDEIREMVKKIMGIEDQKEDKKEEK
jgi:hypothetical protein